MKLVASADFHIGESLPGVDRFDSIEQVFSFAKIKGADYLVVAGDIYDHLMVSNILRARFNLLIKKASQFTKIVLLNGNHDVGGKTTSLAPIESLVGDNIRIISKPSVIRMGGNHVLFIPYTKKMDEGRDRLHGIIKKFEGDYDFVFGHFSVDGVKVGPSNFTLSSGVSRGFLRDNIRSDYIVLGHIHKPQSAGNVIYCGSPDYLDFGERNESKRFLYFNDQGMESIPVLNKELCQVEVGPDGIRGEITKGAIFKVVVKCRKDEVSKIDLPAVSEKIREAGGKIIKLTWNVAPIPRRRAKRIDFRKSLKFNIREYITNFASKKDRKEILRLVKEVWDAASSTKN